jgi:nucleoside phosphorylase
VTGRIAFVCAMPMEASPLVRKLRLTKTRIAGVDAHTGALGDRDVVAIVTGMGTRRSSAATERLLDAVAVDHVVVVGITGALASDTPIGTLVLPEVVVHGDTGTEHRPTALGDGVARGKMWTDDDFITDLDEIARLRQVGVVALDMETAAIARVCEARGKPWSVFRVISDRATDGTVDEEVFRLSNPDGTVNRRAVARYFVRHPRRLVRMARLAKDARRATETAADAAIRACG